MSEEPSPEKDERVDHASGIIAAGKGKIKIVQAMKLVGFSSPERKDMKLYQRVRRRSHQMVVSFAPRTIKKSSLFEVESTLTAPEDSIVTTTNSATSTSTNPTSVAVTPRRLDVASPGEDVDNTSTSTGSETSTARQSGSNPIQMAEMAEVDVKKRRRTSAQVQQDQAKKQKQAEVEKKAMKLATVRIKRHKALPRGHKDKKSALTICHEVNALYGANVSSKTAASYVSKGLINCSPQKRGPSSLLTKKVHEALKWAYVTFIKLEQANAKQQSSIRKLALRVNSCVNKAGHQLARDDLTRRLRDESAHMFEVGKANTIEQRRVEWTTHANLNLWFTTWKETLIELGFAREKTEEDTVEEGEVVFLPGQKERIVNVDETDGTLDDTCKQTGGRPPMVFTAPDVPGGSTSVNKCGYKTTVICGSTAAGEPIPPHFQLKTDAKTDEGQRVSVDWFRYCPQIRGQFGHPEHRLFPVTFGMNEKGGMNAVELKKYLDVAILPLYPDLCDIPGKRVMMKVDSGPGRLNVEMLAHLKLKGMYLMPGVPNTTQVTQETDQSYGQYKSGYRKNLRILSQARQASKKPMLITDLALLIFGGNDRVTGIRIDNTFENSFSVARNLACWKKCGAVPLTRSPLLLQCVRREVVNHRGGSPENAEASLLRDLEKWNHYHCDFLTSNGYDGEQLKAHAPIMKTFAAVTVPNSKERIKAIQRAKTSGQMFYATGGQHLNAEDFFKAKALTEREAKAAVVEKTKRERLDKFQTDQEAKSLLQEKAIDLNRYNEKKFVMPEIKLLCKWKGCKVTSSKNKEQHIAAYENTPRPPTPQPWTLDEETMLNTLKEEEIELKDTALGVAAKQMAAAVTQNMEKLDDESRLKLLQSLAKYQSSGTEATASDPDNTRAVI